MSATEAGSIGRDAKVGRVDLVGHIIGASDIWHGPPCPVEARQTDPDPERGKHAGRAQLRCATTKRPVVEPGAYTYKERR